MTAWKPRKEHSARLVTECCFNAARAYYTATTIGPAACPWLCMPFAVSCSPCTSVSFRTTHCLPSTPALGSLFRAYTAFLPSCQAEAVASLLPSVIKDCQRNALQSTLICQLSTTCCHVCHHSAMRCIGGCTLPAALVAGSRAWRRRQACIHTCSKKTC
jgi:hypothetical protein